MWGDAGRDGTIQPESEKAQEDPINMYKNLMGGKEEKGAKVFSAESTDKTRSNENNFKN